MEDAYATACRIVGDQAVQVALMAAEISRLKDALDQAHTAATTTPSQKD